MLSRHDAHKEPKWVKAQSDTHLVSHRFPLYQWSINYTVWYAIRWPTEISYGTADLYT